MKKFSFSMGKEVSREPAQVPDCLRLHPGSVAHRPGDFQYVFTVSEPVSSSAEGR